MSYLVRMVLLLATLTGLVHIFSVIAIPVFADQKVWQRVIDRMEPRELEVISNYTDARELLGQADPAMDYAICRFDLSNGSVTLTSEGPTEFWNVTIFNTAGEMIYSLHDGVSQTKDLKLEIRNVNDIRKRIAEVAENNTSEPAGASYDLNIPVPSSRPLTDKELKAAQIEAASGDEDSSVVKAELRVNEAFLVLKLFKSTAQYKAIIEETLSNAECK